MSEHPIDRLFATVAERKTADPNQSYTAKLIRQGVLKCAKKFGEEAVETSLAAVAEDKRALTAESADLLYHLMVLWAACDIQPTDVYAKLEARRAQSGLEEKASRKS